MAKHKTLHLKHLIGIEFLNKEMIEYFFERAEYYLVSCLAKNAVLKDLQGKVITTLFFEPSTRTRYSFVLAAKRLGAIVLNPSLADSSTQKGESLIDTVQTFEAMGTDCLIVRHKNNNIADFLTAQLLNTTALVNAGDGSNEHPTQCLLDLFTIYRHKKYFSGLKVAIVGDIAHSRVAHSLVSGLHKMGTEEIRLVGPANFMPTQVDQWPVSVFEEVKSGLHEVDVIYALRIQKERMSEDQLPDSEKFFAQYGVTQAHLAYAKSDVIVMHPGPMNRGVEIESMVADGPHSVILEQVRNGVAIRMAVLASLMLE